MAHRLARRDKGVSDYVFLASAIPGAPSVADSWQDSLFRGLAGGPVNVMQSLCDDMPLIAYKSLLTFTLWRASVQTWHSPGPVVAPGVVPLGSATPGKPMPAAGETAHVRRLLVD